jgi:hypothetical protein
MHKQTEMLGSLIESAPGRVKQVERLHLDLAGGGPPST